MKVYLKRIFIKTSVDDYSACIRRLILLVSLMYSLVLTSIFVIKDKSARRNIAEYSKHIDA